VTRRHLPTAEQIDGWPEYSVEAPLHILVSACITGIACGSDGSSYGAPYPQTARLLQLDNVRPFAFCPEDFAFGTPRSVPDIHGGDGFDVLDGRARVKSGAGDDWTERMIEAAYAMLAVARREQVGLAILMDISAACGSQVIYLGDRTRGVHQTGPGVAAALLVRNGIPVVSQRDYRTLGLVIGRLDEKFTADPGARDHHETEWYVRTFGRQPDAPG
jgi:uncharacterized protein YbbK (DUF523 family)